MISRAANQQVLEAAAHRIASLEFFGALAWIDGTPLLDRIEPYRQRIFEAMLDTVDEGGPSLRAGITPGIWVRGGCHFPLTRESTS